MRGRINAEGAAGDSEPSRLGKVRPEFACDALAVRRGRPCAHHGDRAQREEAQVARARDPQAKWRRIVQIVEL